MSLTHSCRASLSFSERLLGYLASKGSSLPLLAGEREAPATLAGGPLPTQERLVGRHSPGRCLLLKLQGWPVRWQPLQLPSITQRLPYAGLRCALPPRPGDTQLSPFTREQPVETGLRDKHCAALHTPPPPRPPPPCR